MRLAVTSVGWVSALGVGSAACFRRLLDGEIGVKPLGEKQVPFDSRDALPWDFFSQHAVGLVPNLPKRGGEARAVQLALLAAGEALESSGDSGNADLRWGLSVGTTAAGMLEAEALLATLAQHEPTPENRAHFAAYPLDSLVNALQRTLLPQAIRSATVCSACSSSSVSIIQGARWLQQGLVDRVLVGGAEALSFLTLSGFQSLGVVDAAPSRPFDRSRSGLNLGEAAAFLVLQREDSLEQAPLAYLSGWAHGAEAHHITRPEPSAGRVLSLMQEALARAGRAPAAVDYVQAHGTGTPLNDQMEAEALARLFGVDFEAPKHSQLGPLVASCKGQLGHTLGAAGAVGAVISALSLGGGKCPRQPKTDSEFPLNFAAPPGAQASRAPQVVMTSAFGFGGADAVLVFEASGLSSAARAPRTQRVRLHPPKQSDEQAIEKLDPEKSRRFALDAAQIAHATELVRTQATVKPSAEGLVVGNALCSMQRTAAFLSRAARSPRFAAPAEFPHLVPSSLAGLAAVYHALTGPCVTVARGLLSGEAALDFALDAVVFGECPGVVCGAVDAVEPEKRTWLPQLATSQGEEPSYGLALAISAEESPRLGATPAQRTQAHATTPYLLLRRGSGRGRFPRVALSTAERRGLTVVVGASDQGFRAQLETGELAGFLPHYVEDRFGKTASAALLGLQIVFETQAPYALVCGGHSEAWYWWLLGRDFDAGCSV